MDIRVGSFKPVTVTRAESGSGILVNGVFVSATLMSLLADAVRVNGGKTSPAVNALLKVRREAIR